MNRALRVLLTLTLLGAFWSVLIGSVFFLLPAAELAAQPQPSKTPVDPNTQTPSVTPSHTPSVTPSLTPSTTPTHTPSPTSSHTPSPTPSDTPTPTPIVTLPTAPLDPNCQSTVGGYVFDLAGQPVAGATVQIEAAGFAGAMLTNDEGRYGFGSLCAGTATLRARLPDGQVSPDRTVELDGENSPRVDLTFEQQEATATASKTAPAPTPVSEPAMPATGFPYGLLMGAALLGLALLLLAAGRLFSVARSKN